MPAGRCAGLFLPPIVHQATRCCTFTGCAMHNHVPCRAGSPHPLYQKFIDRFSGGEYEELVMEVVHMANEVAAELGEAQMSTRRQKSAWKWGGVMAHVSGCEPGIGAGVCCRPAFPSLPCPAFSVAAAEGAHEGNLPAGLPDGVDVLGGVLQMPAVASVNIRLAGAAALATGDGGARSSFFCTCN